MPTQSVSACRRRGQFRSHRKTCGAVTSAWLVALFAVGSARAQNSDRPSEADMFGGAPTTTTPSAPPSGTSAAPGSASSPAAVAAPSGVATGLAAGQPPAAAAAGATAPPPGTSTPNSGTPPQASAASNRDQDVLGERDAAPKLSQEVAPEDPLRIGGQLYLRANYSRPGSPVFDFSDATVTTSRPITFSTPSLVDGYFDARPNERVRGFVLGRMFFDPTLPSAAAAMSTTGNGTGNVNPSVPLISGASNARGPTVVLDQFWLRFDLWQTIFVTAGRQHVKWGTGRFWTPTDYLHPVRRNPTAVFDARPGFTMLKLHLPWEERGWNFYAFALVEGVRRWDRATGSYVSGSDSTQTLAQIGGAARAELVLGPAELGLDIVAYQNRKPRFGMDLSFGIGDFDLYVDAGFQYGSEIPRIDANYSSCAPAVGTAPQCVFYVSGIKPQVTVGGTYSLKYNDNDVFTIIGEYFYNSRGYSDPRVYPGLFATGTFEFFYTGRHYAALSALLAAPWSWNYTNFTFSTLGNLSDQSFISRLDYSHTLLTHLSVEAYGAVNYGRREGEFRLGVNDLMLGGRTLSLQPQSFSVGMGLRIKI